jgi:hypothetical protein
MEREFKVQVCEECKKGCRPFPTSNITGSEWYCGHCHKSYPMDHDLAQALLVKERQEAKHNG